MNIGGQAIIEGVHIRSPTHLSAAIRMPDDNIKVIKEEVPKRTGFFHKLFLIRGVFRMYDMLKDGTRLLTWSANEQLEADEQDEAGWILYLTTFVSFVIAIVLFKLVPLLIAGFVNPPSVYVFNLIDAVAKFLIFVGYVYFLNYMDDVKRVFQYHGAEHKTIAAHEHGVELTPKKVQTYDKEHKRCGTNFIFVVISVSFFIYALVPLRLDFWASLGARLLFLPLIVGISYEILKLHAAWPNPITHLFIYPGLLIQRLTTKEPDDAQVEVAIAACNAVVNEDVKCGEWIEESKTKKLQ